jgi:hypothetical protein
MGQNYLTPERFTGFAARWMLFSIAAPSLDATYGARTNYAGDYSPEVTLGSYFYSPVSAALVVVLGVILAASFLPNYRCEDLGRFAGVPQGLLAYAALRAAFFFVVHPGECLLFAPSATLAHMLLVAMPFAASLYPHKGRLLAAFAALLFITNGSFILGE